MSYMYDILARLSGVCKTGFTMGKEWRKREGIPMLARGRPLAI